MTFPSEPWGVDTSSTGQGEPTYLAALQDAGCAFVIARAHTGKFTDRVYRATSEEAERLSIPFGAYGVVRPGDPEVQARAFLAALAGTTRELPEVVDWELPFDTKTMTRKQAIANIAGARRYRDIIAAETGRAPLIYCGFGFVDAVARVAGVEGEEDLAALAESGLIVAHYTQSFAHGPTVPRAWADVCWVAWQACGDSKVCRNACQIPGTHRDIDVDILGVSLEEFVAMGVVSVRAEEIKSERSPFAQVA